MIAGIALARGLVLVTGNRGHYERIIRAGHPIEIEDWRVSGRTVVIDASEARLGLIP